MEHYERQFIERTLEHIAWVQNCAILLHNADEDILDFSEWRRLKCRVLVHDHTKFDADILPAYSKYFYCIDNASKITSLLQAQFDMAWELHYTREKHHPEYFLRDGLTTEEIRIAAVECACDLQAMSCEFKQGSCREYWQTKWIPNHIRQCDTEVVAIMERAIKAFDYMYGKYERKCFLCGDPLDK